MFEQVSGGAEGYPALEGAERVSATNTPLHPRAGSHCVSTVC